MEYINLMLGGFQSQNNITTLSKLPPSTAQGFMKIQ